MRTVRLRNGAEEAEPVVIGVLLGLDLVIERNLVAFRELVAKARDDGYQVSAAGQTVLRARGLLAAEGRLHGSIRNVILAAVTGEGEGMVLGNPLAEDARG